MRKTDRRRSLTGTDLFALPAGGAAEGSERTVRCWDARWRRGSSCIQRRMARQLLDLHRIGEGVVLRLQQCMQR